MTFSRARRPTVGSWLERRATIGHRTPKTNRRRWVTPMASDLAAIPPADTLSGTRPMRMEAAPIPLHAAEPVGFTVSRRNDFERFKLTLLRRHDHGTRTRSSRAQFARRAAVATKPLVGCCFGLGPTKKCLRLQSPVFPFNVSPPHWASGWMLRWFPEKRRSRC
jgi:hypothetical protein